MTKTPRVLLILVEPPLPFGNAASRWFYVLVQGFKKRNYDFDVLVTSTVENDLKKARELFKDWPNIYFFSFAKTNPIFSKIKTFLYPYSYTFDSAFKEKLRELNPDSYDIIHVEHTWGGWAAWDWPQKTLLNIHFLLAIDLEDVAPTSLKNRILFSRWFSAQKKLIRHFPNLLPCSPRIQKHIESWGYKKRVMSSIPLGIELANYPFIPTEKRQTAAPIVTIIGNMDWSPSLSAAQKLIADLWPSIHKQVPEARLRVVGWGARTRLKDYLDRDIEILENVPDIRPYFEQASVLVYAPGKGSGMKIKIQEALAFGVPVVTNNEGIEGLMATDMVHVALGTSDEELISKTVRVLREPALQESLRVEGRKMLEEQCGPDVTFEQVAKLHEQIVQLNAKQ